MRGATEVLEEVARLGVKVEAKEDKLVLEPGSKVPPELLAQIREHKVEILSIIRGQNVPALRSRLAALRQRIDKGLETLQAMWELGNTEGKEYPLWLEVWEKLLKEYEGIAETLASLTGCPIGDCSRFESCTTKPAPCPAVFDPSTTGMTEEAI